MNEKYMFTYETKPTEQNIDYMFQRFILSIMIAMQYQPYQTYWNKYHQLFNIVKHWIGIYYNYYDLTKIDCNELKQVDSLITDLKFACLEIDTTYIEEIDIWHGEFLQIWKQCVEKEEHEK